MSRGEGWLPQRWAVFGCIACTGRYRKGLKARSGTSRGATGIGKKASIPVGPKTTFPDCPERTLSSTEKVGSHSCHPNGESPLLWSVTADVFCELRF